MKKFVEFDQSLKAVFTFGSFIEAVDFVNQIADVAEQEDRHPDILLHDEKNVTVTIKAAPEAQITKEHWTLADKIEGLEN
jgi:4a-hydroxytetrahydrobiopterin dehydratase